MGKRVRRVLTRITENDRERDRRLRRERIEATARRREAEIDTFNPYVQEGR